MNQDMVEMTLLDEDGNVTVLVTDGRSARDYRRWLAWTASPVRKGLRVKLVDDADPTRVLRLWQRVLPAGTPPSAWAFRVDAPLPPSLQNEDR